MKFLKSILAAALIIPMISLSGCNNDDKDDPILIYNAFVTYAGATGSTATFTTQEKDDSEIVTFTAEVNTAGLTKNDRYVISYTTLSGKRFQSGPIELYQILRPYQGDTKVESLEKIKELNNATVTCSPGRTGYYINVPAGSEFMPKTFGLYLDEATTSNELPDVYVVFEADNSKPAQAGTYLGSFSFKNVMEQYNRRGIRLHYKENGIDKTMECRVTSALTPAE